MDGGGEGACDAGTDGRRAPPGGPVGIPSKFRFIPFVVPFIPLVPFIGPPSGEPCDAIGE
jgi:hypothetical protein